MSTTLGAVKARTWFHLRDRNPSNRAFSSFEVDAAIDSSMRSLAPRLKMGLEWVTAAVSLTNATDTYSLPGSQSYAQVIEFRLASQGLVVPVIPMAEFEALREGVVNPAATAIGDPLWATVWEEASGTAKVRFYPWPRQADTLDMLRSLLPATLTTDASVIPFDDMGAEALAFTAAALLVGKSAPDVLAQLRLAPEAASVFTARAQDLVGQSRIRRTRMNGASRVPMTSRRW